MTSGLSPTRTWQALVPELGSLATPHNGDTEAGSAQAVAERGADTAERLLLMLHYSVDWDNSWVAEEKHRKVYWDKILPGRVRRAAYRSSTLSEWWSAVSTSLDAPAPRYPDRRVELAALLSEPPLPVLNALHTSLPALLLRVRIIAEAVSAERRGVRA